MWFSLCPYPPSTAVISHHHPSSTFITLISPFSTSQPVFSLHYRKWLVFKVWTGCQLYVYVYIKSMFTQFWLPMRIFTLLQYIQYLYPFTLLQHHCFLNCCVQRKKQRHTQRERERDGKGLPPAETDSLTLLKSQHRHKRYKYHLG